jgi:superfamily II DNA/RNA helicase
VPISFADLGVPSDVVERLAARGIRSPFPIQELTLRDGLAGRDVSGRAPTGSGKTLAFGIPLVVDCPEAQPTRPSRLVLVPTRELATQVCVELRQLVSEGGPRVEAVFGGVPIGRQAQALRRGAEIVVACPGRLADMINQKMVRLDHVDVVVLDEADRMADMGFLPQVEWILRNVEGNHQTLLFSATLDGVVDGLIRRYQHEPSKHEVASVGATVEHMDHLFLTVHEMDKVKVCAAIIRGAGRTMVFSATKHGADRLARKLEDEGVSARAIHGDLRQNLRERALADFSAGKLAALVATDVAARGIHVDEVDVVIHYDPPAEHKTYLHRSGRTARAGESGVVVSLVLWNQELEVRRMQKRLGLDEDLIEVFSNDPRLADVANWPS